MKAAFVILWLAPVWCAAVLFKIAGARGRKEPYRFAMWDGGLMLSGTELGPVGQILWASLTLVLAAVAIAVLARGIPS